MAEYTSFSESEGQHMRLMADILAWQGAQFELCCSGVKVRVTINLGSALQASSSSSQSLMCASAGPWQVSQLMPGSAQTVLYASVLRS